MDINLTSSTIMSYRDLMRTLQKLIFTAWGKDKVQFTSAYPKKSVTENIVPPIITYSVLSKTPGTFGPKNVAEIKPRLRETLVIHEKDKDIPVELMGQTFDYKILFELWSEDGDSADELVERFQQFMTQYTGYLKKAGVSEILFESMDGDLGNGQWKVDLIRRNMVYHIRLDEVSGVRCPVIEEITIGTLIHDTVYNMLLNLYLLDSAEEREVLYQDQVTITSDDDSP